MRNTERLLQSSDPSIHHGDATTCVYRPETALCRTTHHDGGHDAEGPDQSGCRSKCTNLAYTDRDIDTLRHRLDVLETGAANPLNPRPLRDRSAAQVKQPKSKQSSTDTNTPESPPATP